VDSTIVVCDNEGVEIGIELRVERREIEIEKRAEQRVESRFISNSQFTITLEE
jgi:hypothetical protein